MHFRAGLAVVSRFSFFEHFTTVISCFVSTLTLQLAQQGLYHHGLTYATWLELPTAIIPVKIILSLIQYILFALAVVSRFSFFERFTTVISCFVSTLTLQWVQQGLYHHELACVTWLELSTAIIHVEIILS